MSAIDLVARLAGVPQKTIDEIEAALPHTARLLQLFKDNEGLISQGAELAAHTRPLIDEAMALYAKVAPLIKPVMTEINAVLPAAQDVVAFVQKQTQPQPSLPPDFGAGSVS